MLTDTSNRNSLFATTGSQNHENLVVGVTIISRPVALPVLFIGVTVNNIQSFSLNSEQYAKNRPQYPDELFLFLSEISEYHDRAWDCATGNGQAAISCAKFFHRLKQLISRFARK